MTAQNNSRSMSGAFVRLAFVAAAAGLMFAAFTRVVHQSNSVASELTRSVGVAGPVKFAPHLTPIDYATQTDGQHDLQNTGESLDVGIRGDGYLKVKLPPEIADGNGYTRVGMLFTNTQGGLSVAIGGGLELQPAIALPFGAENVEIAEDGTVRYQPVIGGEKVVAGIIHLTRFAHQQLLKPIGRGVLCETRLSGPPVLCDSHTKGAPTLEQGFLELLPELASIPRLGPPMQQGSLQATGLTLDVAVAGNGWFHIRGGLHADSEAFTRNGSMGVNEKGRLSIGDCELVPPVTLPLDATHITIDRGGLVQYQRPGSKLLASAGTIELWQFISPRGLRDEGKGIYTETQDSGPPKLGLPGSEGLGQLIQGYLENRPEQAVIAAGF